MVIFRINDLLKRRALLNDKGKYSNFKAKICAIIIYPKKFNSSKHAHSLDLSLFTVLTGLAKNRLCNILPL